MLVSLAVLALALAVLGVVFTATTRAASQSAAYSEAHNWVRQWMQTIKRDLEACNPSESILILVGRTQAAARTPDDLAAGKFYRVLTGDATAVPANYDPEYNPQLNPQYSDPRADILAFFSARPSVSQAPPGTLTTPNQHLAAGGKQDRVLVVYGHAALGRPVWTGTNYVMPQVGDLKHITQTVAVGGRQLSCLPLTSWHLARRATIILPTSGTVLGQDDRFSPVARAAVVAGEPYLDPRAGAGPLPGDAALLNLSFLLSTCNPGYAPYSGSPPMLQSPYRLDSWPLGLRGAKDALLYEPQNISRQHVATVLEEVPVDLQNNLALHMLPGCAWFQVEFLMPEDPRNSLAYATNPATTLGQRSDMPRWTVVEPGRTYMFVPDTSENRQVIAAQVGDPPLCLPFGRLADFARLDPTRPDECGVTVENRIIRTWPYAIRVTVRVFDPRGRLPEPIVRSVVHRFE